MQSPEDKVKKEARRFASVNFFLRAADSMLPHGEFPEKKGATAHRGWTHPHQGEREMARRRRQIASGQLKKENGLWTS